MALQPIPQDLLRFILTSIPSVPYLEALLLLHANQQQSWNASKLAAQLYVGEQVADDLLKALSVAGIAADDGLGNYLFQPGTKEFQQKLDQLAPVYANNLVEVTKLIHSKFDRRAQQFSDAFKWKKDK